MIVEVVSITDAWVENQVHSLETQLLNPQYHPSMFHQPPTYLINYKRITRTRFKVQLITYSLI